MSKAGPPPGRNTIEDVPNEAIEAFQAGFHGEMILPEDERYDDARMVWNGMINKYPAIIARCSGTADVIKSVDFAREHDLLVAVRGGGHNVAGSAVCDGGIVIDLTEMNGVHVDPTAGTVRAEGGATLGDVDRETQIFGLATPLGVVTETGIAGLTLNGGVGHLRRKYGLACDNIVSADIVTADGEVLTASEDQNEDLFWAIRGGGGNFGVVTSFEYQLHEIRSEVFTLLTFHRGDKAAELLQHFREWASSAPNAASVLPLYAFVPELEEFPEEAWGDPALAFVGCYTGDIDTAEETFQSLREFAEPIVDFSGPMPYTELQSIFDADYPNGRHYYWKATYVEDLTEEVIDLIVRRGSESPSKLSTVDLWHLGGAISDVEQDATAFWHRDKEYMLTFEANWDDPRADEENIAWVRESLAEVEDMPVAAGRYGNFPGLSEDPARTIFGDNYDRLVEVKTKYDPTNLFRLNQNITPHS